MSQPLGSRPDVLPPKEKGAERRKGWRLIRFVGGWVLILLGTAGLFLPFLQGIAFIAAGLALLSKDSPWARRWLERAKGWVRRRKRWR